MSPFSYPHFQIPKWDSPSPVECCTFARAEETFHSMTRLQTGTRMLTPFEPRTRLAFSLSVEVYLAIGLSRQVLFSTSFGTQSIRQSNRAGCRMESAFVQSLSTGVACPDRLIARAFR